MFESIIEIGAKNISQLAIFILIVAGNYVGDTLSCSIRILFRDSMIAKHSICYFIVLLFVGFLQEDYTITNRITLSLFLYFWYIVIMQTSLYFTIPVIILLIVLYIIQEHLNDLHKALDNDAKTYNYEVKKGDAFISKNNNIIVQIRNVTSLRNIIFILTIALSMMGLFTRVYNVHFVKGKSFSFVNIVKGIDDDKCFTTRTGKWDYQKKLK